MDGTGTGRALFTAAEIGALSHLYRGEVYRSTAWRTRLDNTTNWAVITTGVAFSLTFASEDATPLPLILVTLLVLVFLILEARRYRYFTIWRARARLLETAFLAPMLRGAPPTGGWTETLAADLETPRFHVSYPLAVGRRLRKNYGWIFAVQAAALLGKVALHPEPLERLADLPARAAIAAVPGWAVVAAAAGFHLGWVAFAAATWEIDRRDRRRRRRRPAIG
jgi:uncharacterized membrane protein